MSSKSSNRRRRRRRQRSKTAEPKCALMGCDSPSLMECETCGNGVCAGCMVKTMTFCYAEGPGNEKFQFNCSFCRWKATLGSAEDFEEGGESCLKVVLAKAGIRTHAIPNGCCGEKGTHHCVLFHEPCEEHGCYDCFNSIINVARF